MKIGGSVTHMGSDRGSIYTMFGLGARHMGLWAFGLGFKEKLAQPGPFIRTTALRYLLVKAPL